MAASKEANCELGSSPGARRDGPLVIGGCTTCAVTAETLPGGIVVELREVFMLRSNSLIPRRFPYVRTSVK